MRSLTGDVSNVVRCILSDLDKRDYHNPWLKTLEDMVQLHSIVLFIYTFTLVRSSGSILLMLNHSDYRCYHTTATIMSFILSRRVDL